MKYLGIDYGDSKIGLAIGDSETRIASPFGIEKNDKNFLTKLKKIIKAEEIVSLVVGVPNGLQNLKSEQYQKATAFIDKLKNQLKIDIVIQDEKLTTKQAQSLIKGTKRGKGDDDVAAMLILQSYLDKLCKS